MAARLSRKKLPRYSLDFKVLDYWPARQLGDVGWAYVAISGDGFSEAVTVTVADMGGRMMIRELEWGRP
jgi:hypothetical protein